MIDRPGRADRPAPSPRLRLVRDEDQAINDNQAARSAIWWIAPLQVPIWEAFELSGFSAKVSGIPAHLGNLTVRDALVFVALQTMWARLEPSLRALGRVVYSLRSLHAELGNRHAPSADERENLRRSLERLTYATIERMWWDVTKGEEVHQVRRLIADADFIRHGRPGQYGRSMRGFIAFAPELLRQLEARQFAYALDLPTLLDLPSPLAQRLYLLLASDQMKPFGGPGSRLVAFDYPLGRLLHDNLGITDTNHVRVRQKLAAAGLEICRREPLYQRIELRRRSRGKGWLLRVEREQGRSKAPLLRREQAARAQLMSARSALDDALPDSSPVAVPVREQRDPAEQKRFFTASADPRVKAAFERWLVESGRGVGPSLAWQEYHRDLRAWVADGEIGPAPAEPEPDLY